MQQSIRILAVHSSARGTDSVSRTLTNEMVEELGKRYTTKRTDRDLADGIEFVDEDWVAANLTPADERNDAQIARLAGSDELIAELKQSDVIVIGAPIYNFGIPATLKAWIDQIARARVTFRYTQNGPVGLLTGKKAFVVVASGGVGVGSQADFATPYLKHALAFVGIHDVEFIAAEKLNTDSASALDSAREAIARQVHTTAVLTIDAA